MPIPKKRQKAKEYSDNHNDEKSLYNKERYRNKKDAILAQHKKYNKTYLRVPEKTKETQNKFAKNKHAKYRNIRIETEKKFGGKCCTCDAVKHPQFHHLWYGNEGKQSTKPSTTEKLRFMKEIEQYPERFMLLCAGCHSPITGMTLFAEKNNNCPLIAEVIDCTINSKSRKDSLDIEKVVIKRRDREGYKQIRANILSKFESKCYVCKDTEHLQFHHLSYTSDEKKVNSNSSISELIKHVESIEQNPEKYMLLCSRCHSSITRVILFIAKRHIYPKIDKVLVDTMGPERADKLLWDLGLNNLFINMDNV
jgi:hypothetical protein